QDGRREGGGAVVGHLIQRSHGANRGNTSRHSNRAWLASERRPVERGPLWPDALGHVIALLRRRRVGPHHGLPLVSPSADRIFDGPGRNLVGFRLRLDLGEAAGWHVGPLSSLYSR